MRHAHYQGEGGKFVSSCMRCVSRSRGTTGSFHASLCGDLAPALRSLAYSFSSKGKKLPQLTQTYDGEAKSCFVTCSCWQDKSQSALVEQKRAAIIEGQKLRFQAFPCGKSGSTGTCKILQVLCSQRSQSISGKLDAYTGAHGSMTGVLQELDRASLCRSLNQSCTCSLTPMLRSRHSKSQGPFERQARYATENALLPSALWQSLQYV